jgi:hypothetical protein
LAPREGEAGPPWLPVHCGLTLQLRMHATRLGRAPSRALLGPPSALLTMQASQAITVGLVHALHLAHCTRNQTGRLGCAGAAAQPSAQPSLQGTIRKLSLVQLSSTDLAWARRGPVPRGAWRGCCGLGPCADTRRSPQVTCVGPPLHASPVPARLSVAACGCWATRLASHAPSRRKMSRLRCERLNRRYRCRRMALLGAS